MENYKLSKYNHFLKKRDKVIGLNLYNKKLFSISTENYSIFNTYKTDLQKLQNDRPILFSTLYKLGIIEDIDMDIPNILLMKNRQQVFSNSSYRLIINPTLNCNFSCWYCYEAHNKQKMSNKTVDVTIKYIDNLINKKRWLLCI